MNMINNKSQAATLERVRNYRAHWSSALAPKMNGAKRFVEIVGCKKASSSRGKQPESPAKHPK